MNNYSSMTIKKLHPLPVEKIKILQQKSLLYRRTIVQMIYRAKAGHTGGSLSCVDILNVLYNHIMNITPENFTEVNRDHYIHSKGHSVEALYAVLADKGFFPIKLLDHLEKHSSDFIGHPTRSVLGIEQNTGALGHGLSVAVGMALAAKRDGKTHRVFVMLSDGECDEGSTWEPILFAPQHKLDNLIAIVDYNKIQSLGTVKEVMDLDPFADKWRAFGWAVCEIDGHNLVEVEEALSRVPFEEGRPSCVIAHTVKGKGVSFMENKLLWHYRTPQGEEYEAALTELKKEK